MKKRVWLIFLLLPLLLIGAFLIYAMDSYLPDSEAYEALKTDEQVAVTDTGYGWYFDGPSEDALIFYPGAKVAPEAYAPLLRGLAQDEMDVALVKMPLNFAFLGLNRADTVMKEHTAQRWFIGGHSLGGAMAANYAASHENLQGLILLAAYATKPLPEGLTEILLYGSEDSVVSIQKIEDGRAFAPADYHEFCIDGGNHAQFGSYGIQSGDGEARLSREQQQTMTILTICEILNR